MHNKFVLLNNNAKFFFYYALSVASENLAQSPPMVIWAILQTADRYRTISDKDTSKKGKKIFLGQIINGRERMTYSLDTGLLPENGQK